MKRAALVVAMALVLLSACAAETATAPTTSTPEVQEPSTTTTTVGESTTTVASTVTTAGAIVVGTVDFGGSTGPGRLRLSEGRRYLFRLPLEMAVDPSDPAWSVLGFREQTAALFGWSGPSGFRPETLDVLVFDPGSDVEAAWDRFEQRLDETFDAVGQTWSWTDTGTMAVGGREVEWREVRMHSELPPDRAEGDPRVLSLSEIGQAVLWRGTTARVAVVDVDGLTLTIVAYETRCACEVRISWSRGSNVDAVENELGDWIPELESFLASIEIGSRSAGPK